MKLDILIRIVVAAIVVSRCGSRVVIGQESPLHQCAVKMHLNTHEGGYSGSGTGTLIKYENNFYLATALHNLQHSKAGITFKFASDVFFNKTAFADYFISVPGADLAVAKFVNINSVTLQGKRFLELQKAANGRATDPQPGQVLAAVGNPVFAFEKYNLPQNNIVYQGIVADIGTPARVIGNSYLTDRMLILESLSIMAGFSGGPLVRIRDGEIRSGDIAGVVVAGDYRSIVSPGRFVFAVPPSTIEAAIVALEGRLQKNKAPTPSNMQLSRTDLADVPAPINSQLKYSVDRVEVIDVMASKNLEQISPSFLDAIAERVENSDMIFHGGTFGDLDLSRLRPSRATFVKCIFTSNEALNRMNLMGARFVDCALILPGGTPQSIKLIPKLGYGITIVDGGYQQPKSLQEVPIFEEYATASKVGELSKAQRRQALSSTIRLNSDIAQPAPRPVSGETPRADKPSKLSRHQFQNVLSQNLIH